jgi:sulfatase modifying factor 1
MRLSSSNRTLAPSASGRRLAIAVAVVGAVSVLGALLASRSPAVATESCLPAEELGEFIQLPGGGYVRGSRPVYAEEGPPSTVFVSPFLIQAHEVTNAEFQRFVAATGYVTAAERGRGSALFDNTASPTGPQSWWRLERGAAWHMPAGPGSDVADRSLHPVVHVTLADARAYATWAGGRLPSEVEWEYAATLGLFDPANPDSGVLGENGELRANIWQGEFPSNNTLEDGHQAAAPVGCFAASRIGTYDMLGNVWEWTDTPFGRDSGLFVIKGGSYLCSANYCRRYRPAARGSLAPDLSTAHVGFRIVKDL